MFKSKIHRATFAHGNLHDVGSLTLDQDLHVDRDNRIVAVGTDPAEAAPGVIHDSATG